MFHRCDDHGENLSLTRRTFNITQKISICKFNYTKNIYLFCYGNGGVRAAGARRLLMDLMDLIDQMDKIGAPRYTPWGCLPLCGLARVKMCRWGMPGFFYGNGGVRAAGVWRNKTVTNGG